MSRWALSHETGLHSVVNLYLQRYVSPFHHQNILSCVSVTRPVYLFKKKKLVYFTFIRALRPEFPSPVGIVFAVDSSQVDRSGHVTDAVSVTEATTLIMCEVLGVELVNLY